MPEELLPKPLTDLPLPRPQMPEHSDGGQAQTDLPLPERDLPAQTESLGENDGDKNRGQSKSKFLILGVVAILIFLGIAGAYFLGKNSSSKQMSQAPTVTQTPSPSPTVDPTADWKTFENSPKTLSIKYSPDWTPLENERLVRFFPPGVTIEHGLGPSDPNAPYISIELQENVNPLVCRGDCPSYENPQPIKVGSYDATMYSGKEGGVIGPLCDCNYEKVILKNGNTYYLFQLSSKTNSPNGTPDPITEEDKTIFEQMLSTFKFTDSASTDNSAILNEAIKDLGVNYTGVMIKKAYGKNYALGSAGFTNSGGGIEFIVHKENGTWKVIWRGNEVPGCSKFTSYPDFPKELNCDPSY